MLVVDFRERPPYRICKLAKLTGLQKKTVMSFPRSIQINNISSCLLQQSVKCHHKNY